MTDEEDGGARGNELVGVVWMITNIEWRTLK